MELQVHLVRKNDLSKTLLVEMYDDGIEVTGNETDAFAHTHSSLFTDYSFPKLMEATDTSGLSVTAIAFRDRGLVTDPELEPFEE